MSLTLFLSLLLSSNIELATAFSMFRELLRRSLLRLLSLNLLDNLSSLLDLLLLLSSSSNIRLPSLSNTGRFLDRLGGSSGARSKVIGVCFCLLEEPEESSAKLLPYSVSFRCFVPLSKWWSTFLSIGDPSLVLIFTGKKYKFYYIVRKHDENKGKQLSNTTSLIMNKSQKFFTLESHWEHGTRNINM